MEEKLSVVVELNGCIIKCVWGQRQLAEYLMQDGVKLISVNASEQTYHRKRKRKK